MIDLSVVTPAYGNAATLPELVRRIRSAAAPLGSFEILVVDDASTDGTGDVLEALAASEPALAALGLARNAGQQRAIRAGLAEARGRRIVVLDADLQDPPEAIPALVAALDRAAAVFGGRRGRYQPWPRRFSSRLFKLAQAALCGVPTDAGLFFALRREVAVEIASHPESDAAIVPLIGALAPGSISLPVARSPRPTGRSAYRGAMRLRAGARVLGFALRRRFGRAVPAVAGGALPREPVAYRLGWLARRENAI